jgi:hypothetical protein
MMGIRGFPELGREYGCELRMTGFAALMLEDMMNVVGNAVCCRYEVLY